MIGSCVLSLAPSRSLAHSCLSVCLCAFLWLPSLQRSVKLTATTYINSRHNEGPLTCLPKSNRAALRPAVSLHRPMSSRFEPPPLPMLATVSAV